MNQMTLLKVRIDQRVIVLLPECGDGEMFGEEGRGSSAASEPEPSHTDPAPQSDVTWPWCGDQPLIKYEDVMHGMKAASMTF